MSYIKGITIEIDGETKGLDAALRKINSTTKSLQNELKRVDQLLKLNPGNIDLVKQKQELLKQAISETKTKLDALKQAQEQMKATGIDESSANYRRLQREIEETTVKLKSLEFEQAKFSVTGSKIGQITAQMAQLGEKATALGQKLRGLSTAAGLIGIGAAKTTSDFDTAMSKVQAISGATGDAFNKLRDKAREMGANTKFSATEAAEAMNYMAMAGWSTGEMLDGIEGIMYLAAASGEDLATTSDIVTDALTAMGYAAKDSGRMADVLAAASANSNTNVGMMGETFKYVAAVAGSMHYSMEDVALATGLMANAGIKATQAGTSLRSIISRMAAPTSEVSSALDKLGVAISNADGSARPLRDVMADLRTKMASLSDTEKTQIANAIAGKNAMSGFMAIINASDDDFNSLASSIDNADGAAEKMANTMLDNLGGQLTILKSALQELGIALGDSLIPMAKKVVAVVQEVVDWFNGLSDGTKRFIADTLVIVAALAPVLLIFGKLTSGINSVVGAFGTMYAQAVTGQGIIGFLVQTVFPALKTALTSLFAILSANPIGLVIAAVAALIAIFVLLWNKCEGFREFWIELWNKLSAFLKDIVEAIKADFTNTVDAIKTAWNDCKNFFISVWNGIKNLFDAVVSFWLNPFQTVWNLIKNIWNAAPSWFKNIGSNIMQGLWNGISGLKDWVISKVSALGSSILNGLKRALGIHSPSKEFAKLGKFSMRGLAEGISDNEKLVTNALDSVTDIMLGKDMSVNANAMLSHNTAAFNADSLSSKIVNGMIGALSGIKLENNMEIDGKVIARTITPIINLELGRCSNLSERGV